MMRKLLLFFLRRAMRLSLLLLLSSLMLEVSMTLVAVTRGTHNVSQFPPSYWSLVTSLSYYALSLANSIRPSCPGYHIKGFTQSHFQL